MNRKRITVSVLVLLAFASALVLAQTGAETSPRSLARITSREQFDSIAVTYDPNSPYALPHVLFVIDRKDNNRVYYVNTWRYRFHKDFVNGNYLSLERGNVFFENNYLKPNRRFILGNVAYQTPVKRWTFEFWEGDLITPDLIQLTANLLNQTFYMPLAFKPNSIRQEEVSASIAGLSRILQSDISREQEYQALNIAKGIGRIHIIPKLDDHVEIGSNEILVLNEVPVQLPPVAGIITTMPSTPLSHINLLARGRGIPNAYIKNAQELFKQYDGWWVTFETRRGSYSIKRADIDELRAYQKRMSERLDIMKPHYDLSERRLLSLAEQHKTMSLSYGGKSANLGEVLNAHLPGIDVPDGFTIPFYYYDAFLKDNNFDEALSELLNDQKFVHDPAYRRQRLVETRQLLQSGKFDPKLREQILRHIEKSYAGQGLFLRSSSNSEDLPNFSGAGLYTTVPNARGADQIIEGIKKVWASLWNFEAYEARERAGVDHMKIFMAVLIQKGINSESSGVMITTDPFDRENKGAIYISAKRGLGSKVVEGPKVAEQIIYSPRAKATQVLTRSEEDSLLTFDERGGLKEVPITGECAVLTDSVIQRLVQAALEIKRVFGNGEQDIEWAYMNGQLYIVQSRPFIAGG
jgi:hypothetical protein